MKVPDLTKISERNDGRFPADKISHIIDGRVVFGAHGPRQMPVWGHEFWVEEGADDAAEDNVKEIVDKLVRYLQSIQAK